MLKLLLFSLISHGGSLPSKSLYEEDTDFIQILTQETFKETLERPEEKNQFWIVEFYASWCGHCVHFAPTIKEFAGEIKEWTNLVKLGVIDCGNKENGDICRENQVQGFPTMKYFLPNDRVYDQKENILEAKTVEALKQETLKLALENNVPNANGLGRYLSLEKIEGASVSDVVEQNSKDNVLTALVAAPSDLALKDGTAIDLLADLTAFADISIRLTDVPSLEKWSKSKEPVVLILDHDAVKMEIELTDTTSRSDVLAVLASTLKTEKSSWKNVVKNSIKEEAFVQTNDAWAKYDQSKVYLQDVESALLQMLFYDVNSFPLEEDYLRAIKKYVKIVSELYPSTTRNIDVDLRNLSSLLEDSKVERVRKRKDWIGLLDKAGLTKLQGSQPDLSYAACTPSVENLRGYTCGLWTSFHLFLSLSSDEQAPLFAEAMSEMILNHFSCLECRKNFRNEIELFPLSDVTDHSSGVRWIWKLHNSVNARLAGEKSEDPKFPKIQYPQNEECALCKTADDFEMEETLKYLDYRYSKENLVLADGEKMVDNSRMEDDSDEVVEAIIEKPKWMVDHEQELANNEEPQQVNLKSFAHERHDESGETTLEDLLKELHKIGYDSNEINEILNNNPHATLEDKIRLLKKKVEAFLIYRKSKMAREHKDLKIIDELSRDPQIPLSHRTLLLDELAKMNAIRKEVEAEFNFIGFSILDTYFCILLWTTSTSIILWFYCGYNCRCCYARRKPIYRFQRM